MNYLRAFKCILITTVAAANLVAMPALAHKGGRGPKIEVRDNGKEYKYEYKDRRCKYEYRLNYRTGKEKVKQKGDCRGVSPQRAVYYDEGPIVIEEGAPPVRRRLACSRDVVGAVLGGVAGGVIGSQVGDGDGKRVATAAGAIIGAVIGGNMGRRMDRADNSCAHQAFEFAAPGETVFWRNPESQIEYGITPSTRSRRADGRECRPYEASVVAVAAGSSQKSSSGLACRRSDGSWEIQ